jgi:hypothetical protein
MHSDVREGASLIRGHRIQKVLDHEGVIPDLLFTEVVRRPDRNEAKRGRFRIHVIRAPGHLENLAVLYVRPIRRMQNVVRQLHVPFRSGEQLLDVRLPLGLKHLGGENDASIPKLGQQRLHELHIIALPVVFAEDHDAVTVDFREDVVGRRRAVRPQILLKRSSGHREHREDEEQAGRDPAAHESS